MKNQKIKNCLTVVTIVALFISLILMLIAVLTEDALIEDPMFYTWEWTQQSGDTWLGHYNMDWNYAGIFLALLLLALAATITKFVLFTIPSFKGRDNNAELLLGCEIAVIVGLILAVIALFLPINLDMDQSYSTNAEPARMTAARLLSMMAIPLSFMSALGAVGLSLKNKY